MDADLIAYGTTEISFLAFYYIVFEPNTINQVNSRRLMYDRDAAGCSYHPNGCSGSGVRSNTTLASGATYVILEAPYNEQMVFYGISRMIVTWDGTTAFKPTFDTGPITRHNS